jgi:hypothetical protein
MFSAPLDVVQYLVQEYPESLQLGDHDGNKAIDLAKSPWRGKTKLHEVLAWLKLSAVAGGVAVEPLSSLKPLVQPVNFPYHPAKRRLFIQLPSILPSRRSSHRHHCTLSIHRPSAKN